MWWISRRGSRAIWNWNLKRNVLFHGSAKYAAARRYKTTDEEVGLWKSTDEIRDATRRMAKRSRRRRAFGNKTASERRKLPKITTRDRARPATGTKTSEKKVGRGRGGGRRGRVKRRALSRAGNFSRNSRLSSVPENLSFLSRNLAKSPAWMAVIQQRPVEFPVVTRLTPSILTTTIVVHYTLIIMISLPFLLSCIEI